MNNKLAEILGPSLEYRVSSHISLERTMVIHIHKRIVNSSSCESFTGGINRSI